MCIYIRRKVFRIHVVYLIHVYLADKHVASTPVKRAIKFFVFIQFSNASQRYYMLYKHPKYYRVRI